MERHQIIILVALSLAILYFQTAQAEFTVPPNNQAVLLFRNATLNCTSNISQSADIEWIFTPVGNESEVSLGRCQNGALVNWEWYELEAVDEFSCNIKLINVTSEMGGTYSCVSQSEQPAMADVIVLNTRPICTVDGVLTHALKLIYASYYEEKLHICSFNFTGPQNFIPVMNWTTGNILLNSSEELSETSLISSQLVEIYYLPSAVMLLTWFTENPDFSLPEGLNPVPPDFSDTWTVIYNRFTPVLPGINCGGCSCIACYVPVTIACVVGAIVISLSIFCIVKRAHKKTDTGVYTHEVENAEIEMDVKL